MHHLGGDASYPEACGVCGGVTRSALRACVLGAGDSQGHAQGALPPYLEFAQAHLGLGPPDCELTGDGAVAAAAAAAAGEPEAPSGRPGAEEGAQQQQQQQHWTLPAHRALLSGAQGCALGSFTIK